MRLQSLTVERFHLNLRHPVVTASQTFRVRDGFTVTLQTDEGPKGIGESTPLESFGTETLSDCREVLLRAAETLKDQPLPESLDAIGPWLEQLPEFSTRPAARHGVELALLDLLAQSALLPLSKLLNPSARSSVEVNALLSAQSIAELAEEARTAVREGYTTVKLKVGAGLLERDLERLRTVRAAAGPKMRIRIDANGTWTEGQAVEALSRFDEFKLELCEQPTEAHDISALRRVQTVSRVPIAADESLSIGPNIDRLLEEPRAVEYFVLKPMVLGGILPAFQLAGRGQSAGIICYVTHSLDGEPAWEAALHLAAAIPSPGVASGLSPIYRLRHSSPSIALPVQRPPRKPGT